MYHGDFKINGIAFQSIQQNPALMGSTHADEYLQKVIKLATEVADGSTAIQVQTSGSTGAPKTRSLDRKELWASAEITLDRFSLAPSSKALLCLPITAISGLMMLVRAMRGGLDLYVTPTNSTPLASFQSEQAPFFDFIALTPYQLTHSYKHLHLSKMILVGGASLSDAQIVAMPKDLNVQVVESYGMTETLSHVALRNRYPVEDPCFTAIGDVKFSLGQSENLIIYAPHLKEPRIETSDRVHLISESQFYFLGRVDNVINSGGIKFFAEQIERKVQHLMREPFFVAAVPHETLGEQLVLIIQGNDDRRVSQVQKGLEEVSWKAYEKPKKVYRVSQFRYTSTQKIDRPKTLSVLDL